MLDDILDYAKDIRERPVRQRIPDDVPERFRSDVPAHPACLSEVHREFMNYVLPYAVGNLHPGFMGWSREAGRQSDCWRRYWPRALTPTPAGCMQEVFSFPDTATGLFVIGASMANFIAVVIARYATLGTNHNVRAEIVCASCKRENGK
jgi:aromatic-L-amino-acid/L-tryptophan decarboxylase